MIILLHIVSWLGVSWGFSMPSISIKKPTCKYKTIRWGELPKTLVEPNCLLCDLLLVNYSVFYNTKTFFYTINFSHYTVWNCKYRASVAKIHFGNNWQLGISSFILII